MKDVNLLISNGVNIEKSLELFGDMETYNDTLHDFLSEVEGKLAKIKAYKENGDMANYAILVHAMKSNARSFGFMKLGDICYEHEMKSKAGDASYVNEHFNELLNAFNEVYTIITNYKNL